MDATEMDFLPVGKPLSENDEAEVLKFVMTRYDAARRFDRDFKVMAAQDWYYLNGILPRGWNERFFNRNFLPESLIGCRDTCESVMSTLFPRDEFFDVWPEEGQPDVAVEMLRERMKQRLLAAQYKANVYDWGDEAIRYGNGLISTCTEPNWEEPEDEEAQNPDTTMSAKSAGLRTHIRMKVVSRFDQFPFPGYYNDVQRMPFYIVREYVPMSEFRQRARWEHWSHVDQVKGWLFSERSARDDDEYETQNLYTRLEYTGFGVSGADHGVETIMFTELLHYYEAPPAGVGCRAYAVVADGKTLLCCRGRKYRHAMKPLADLRWQPLDSQMHQAIGVTRMMRPYQDLVNVREAQYSDMMEYQVRPMRLAGQALGVKPLTRLYPWPGQVIGAQDIKDERLLEMPSPNAGLLTLSDRAHLGIQRVSRTDASRGLMGRGTPTGQSGSVETATGMKILTNSDAKSAAFEMLFFETRGLEPQLYQFGSLVQETIAPQGEVVTMRERNDTLKAAGMLGNSFLLRPRDVAGRFSFRCVGSTKAMEGAEMAVNILNMTEKGFRELPEFMNSYDPMKVLKRCYELTTHRSLSEFERSPEEQEQRQQKGPPVPPALIPKYKDLQPPQKDVVAERIGLPKGEGAMSDAAKATAKIEETRAKEQAKTTRDVGKELIRHGLRHVAGRGMPVDEPAVPAAI